MATPNAGWPEISENQENKEVTHNEALRLIEAISYRVLSRSNGGPPSNPSDGDSYIVDTATGDWSIFSVDDVAAHINGGWINTQPFEGLGSLWVNDEDAQIRYDGSAWARVEPGVDVEDSGSLTVQKATNVNFDANLTVTDDGDGTVTVDASSGSNGVDAEDNGSIVVSGSTALNFASNLSVTDDGDGTVSIDASSGGVTVEDGGTSVVSGATAINFASNVSVTDDGDGTVTVDSSGGAGSITWSQISSATTVSVNTRYLADTSGGAFTATMPSSPSTGDTVYFADAARSWGTNNLTIDGNGNNVIGNSSLEVDVSEWNFSLIYNGTQWVFGDTSGNLFQSPESATDSGTDAYVSDSTTSTPTAGVVISRDFQSANTTTTPTLDSVSIVARDGSAVWVGSLNRVHYLLYDGTNYRVVNPNYGDDVTGTDGTVVTGTAGTGGNLAEWNADGDAVDSGAALAAKNGTVTELTQALRKNAFINGGFDIWQRGTSFSSSGYWADRWRGDFGDGAGTVSQQAFTSGQTAVPGEPKFYLRHDRTTASTVANRAIAQRAEDVRTLAGRKATISFYAKADASKGFTIRLVQDFGSGSNASADVVTSVGTLSVGTSWTRYTFTVDVPGISGKTIDGNDSFLQFDITEDANFSTFTLDIAQVQIEEGPVATPFDRRPIGEELALCQRYWETGRASIQGYANSSGQVILGGSVVYSSTKRINPALSFDNFADKVNAGNAGSIRESRFSHLPITSAGSSGFVRYSYDWHADAEL